MYPHLQKTIELFSENAIPLERKKVLQPLIEYLQAKVDEKKTLRINFICTHNSRRSHLAQIWAQSMAYFFEIKNCFCYSGGTEATAMFPKIADILTLQGFKINTICNTTNPIITAKYNENEPAIICFSKEYFHPFNPLNNFIAVVTCNSADEACPLVLGAEQKFSIKYEDPKIYDNTPEMDFKYTERSLEIGQEMWYVFKSLKN